MKYYPVTYLLKMLKLNGIYASFEKGPHSFLQRYFMHFGTSLQVFGQFWTQNELKLNILSFILLIGAWEAVENEQDKVGTLFWDTL